MTKLMKMVLSAWCLVLGAGVATAAELPTGYTAVEYIESTRGGGQFIDTGYTANGQTKVVMDAFVPARWEQNDRFGVLFGSRTMTDWWVKAFALQMCDGNSGVDTVRFAYNGWYRQDGAKPFSFGERVTVTCDGEHVEWTGSKAASVDFTSESLSSSKSTLYIFADNSVADDGAKSKAGLNHSVMRLYSFRITEGETLKRDFVPCVRTADAVAGLYDKVEGKFYGNAGMGNFATSASNLPFGRELASGTYEITESFAFAAPMGESALKIAEGATVTLNIAAGVTVALRGGDAFEVWGAGAGIEVPANATLKVTGVGQLVAYGGKGANGCDGMAGGNGSADGSNGNFTSGAGGAGGWGGGGAGAGIGGHGTSGGGGGNGGKSVTGYDWSHTDISGNSGDNGGAGKKGGTCGTVLVEGTVKVFAYGGTAGDADGAGGANGDWASTEGSTYYFGAWGGGGGGGGAKGGAAADIGGGGAGGYGGGGGGSGAYHSRFTWSTISAMPGWGAGGAGAANGAAGGESSRDDEDVSGGSGGAKGAAGAKGGNGTLAVADGAAACAAEGRYSVGRLSDTVEIFYDNGKLLWVSGGTSSNLSYSVVNNDTETLGTGWYVVKGTVSRTDRILVSGAANLVLLHGSSLTVDCRGITDVMQYAPGIEVCDDNSLRVFGTETGILTAMGSANAAGIGTANRLYVSSEGPAWYFCNSCGSIAFYGGTVTAQGGESGAGIGGGFEGGGGTVTINGGTVTATGGWHGAGIGGGNKGAGGSLTLRPCVYKIDGNHWREGVTVSFVVPDDLSVVSATGGRTWMEGSRYFVANLEPGYTVTFTFGAANFEHRLTGDATVSFGPVFSNTVIDASRLPRAVEAEKLSVDYALPKGGTATATNVCPLFSTDLTMSLRQSAWYVVIGEVTTSRLEVHGGVNLILADGAKLTVNGGIGVNQSVIIHGQNNGTGQLIANGVGENRAGIRGGNGAVFSVVINGGTVIATGGDYGAGIGGGDNGAGGMVTINGGTVTATGGWQGAGIGGGAGGAGGSVAINGGTVTATGGQYGAGIGGGAGGAGGTVMVNGGTVTAKGGQYGAGIGGGGYKGNGGMVTINGGTVTATGGESAAGIGGGRNGDGFNVTIKGGTVTATGGESAAGIGGGDGGAVGKVTINGGEVTATGKNGGAGIGGRDGASSDVVTLDLTKVEVVEGAVGNGHSYVKIVEKKPVGPTCEGGEIAEGEDGVWVVTPEAGVTEVSVTGLPEGDFVAVPPSVMKVSGVADAQVKVRSGAYDITGAFTVSGGEIALNPNGAVTIGGEEIPVKPTIGDLDEGEPFMVDKGVVMVAVRAIPGLRYALVRGEALPAPQRVICESVVATGARVALSDANPPAGKAFYIISVSCPAAVGPSDSTIRIVAETGSGRLI